RRVPLHLIWNLQQSLQMVSGSEGLMAHYFVYRTNRCTENLNFRVWRLNSISVRLPSICKLAYVPWRKSLPCLKTGCIQESSEAFTKQHFNRYTGDIYVARFIGIPRFAS